jgi:hypothetical protein
MFHAEPERLPEGGAADHRVAVNAEITGALAGTGKQADIRVARESAGVVVDRHDACEKRAGRVNGLAFTDLWE